ncbi:MAG: type I-E CRISPR-associated protein Cse2/CasB [Actinobacteria bacterium]|nr:type I-E CRISPR-associated protein Cse2/CasB [Actinomycetota bacterium]MCG2803612.1 type I-E CRISPR-associated protein Cse2/CasB [Cellulomonas sp.]
MSETTTIAEAESPPGGARTWVPGLTQKFVDAQVSRLQAGYLRRPPSSRARADLARLRRVVGHEPGTDVEILDLTTDPDAPRPAQDEPTADERAIHVALTLYAVHQQSQERRMHVQGRSFGSALGRLRYVDGEENPGVVRRFQALGTATDLAEAATHARALVTLLRGAGQGFDYGLLARDLVALQDPRRAQGVRLAWGRDFFRTRATAPDGAADGADTTTPTAEELS